jgi:hypothetical protein
MFLQLKSIEVPYISKFNIEFIPNVVDGCNLKSSMFLVGTWKLMGQNLQNTQHRSCFYQAQDMTISLLTA